MARKEPVPVVYSWRLPHRHGNLFWYQQLVLKVPWRDASPEAFMDPAANPRACLRQECIDRGILEDGDDGALIRAEASRRLFRPADVERMVAETDDFDELMAVMELDKDPLPHAWTVGPQHADSTDMLQLANRIRADRRSGPHPPPPSLTTEAGKTTWHHDDGDMVLTAGQYEAFELLRQSGLKHIFAFLSGEGGMGKSKLTELLVAQLRSDGYNVIVLGSTAKAASLVGGVTALTGATREPATARPRTSREPHRRSTPP